MTTDPTSDVRRGAPLRAAFVGGGVNSAVGNAHRTALSLDGIIDLVCGCFSEDRAINHESAARYGVPDSRVHDDLTGLLAAEADALDAVIVLTPTGLHHANVVECLEAGVGVVCEKAVGVNAKEIVSIRDLAVAKRGFVAAIYNYTGYPMVRELRDMIARGRLGTVQQIHVEMPQESFVRHDRDDRPPQPQEWRRHDGEVPTVSLDLGVHLHHLVSFLTDRRPLRAVALENHFGEVEGVVDNVIGLVQYSDDLVCNLWFGKTALGNSNGLRVRVYGDRGSAEWFQQEPEFLLHHDLRGGRHLLDRSSAEVEVAGAERYNRFKAGHPSGFIEAFANHYQDIAAACRAHRRGVPFESPYVAGPEIALEGIRLMEALSQSARRREWVDLES